MGRTLSLRHKLNNFLETIPGYNTTVTRAIPSPVLLLQVIDKLFFLVIRDRREYSNNTLRQLSTKHD